ATQTASDAKPLCKMRRSRFTIFSGPTADVARRHNLHDLRGRSAVWCQSSLALFRSLDFYRCVIPAGSGECEGQMNTTAHDPDAGVEPAYAAPTQACDAHFHVFGSEDHYHYGWDLRYKPPCEPLEAYLKLARRIGFERFVFVQPSAYGFDNSCMFDAMRQMEPSIRRGIVDLDETSTTDRQLAEWNALGVRGIRVNISPVSAPEAGLAASMVPRIARLAALCRELGWHLDFLTPGWLVSELTPTLRELPIEFSVAHF